MSFSETSAEEIPADIAHTRTSGSKNSLPNSSSSSSSAQHDNRKTDSLINWYSILVATIGILLMFQFITYLLYISLGLILGLTIFLYIATRRIEPSDANDLKDELPRIAFTHKKHWLAEMQILKSSMDIEKMEPLFPEDFLISDTLDNILDLIIRDFIQSWFTKITPDPTFPFQLKLVIGDIIRILKERLANAEFSELLIYKIIPLFNDHFDKFIAAHDIVTNKSSMINRTLTNTWDLDNVICANYNQGSLHPAIQLKGSAGADEHVKKWMTEFLGKYLQYMAPREEISSPPVFILTREILTTCVLYPVFKMVSDPDFWNQIIVNRLGDIMKDRAHVKKFRNALSKHTLEKGSNDVSKTDGSAKSATEKKNENSLMGYRLTATTDNAKYEKIAKKVSQCKSLADLKQYKYLLSLQINKSLRELAEVTASPYSTPKSVEVLKIYSKRLQTLKSLTESTIYSLISQESGTTSGSSSMFDPQTFPSNITLDISLMQVLSQPSYLSYFMEFMDLRNRSMLLQLWLTVNGIKNPLEDLFDNPDNDGGPLEEENGETDDEKNIAKLEVMGKDMSQAGDIKQIFYQFFGDRLLKIDNICYSNVAKFVETKPENPLLYIKARQSILSLQKKVFDRMQKTDFVAFKQSDLFLRLLASDTEQQNSTLRRGTTEQDYKDDDEFNGDPIASFDENVELNNDEEKVSSAVLKAVEDALNEIMHDDTTSTGVTSSQPPSTADSVNSAFKTSEGNKSSSNLSTPEFNEATNFSNGNGSPIRNSRLINKDLHRDLFGGIASEPNLFDDQSDIDSDKNSTRLFDDDDSDIEEDDENNNFGTDSLSSSLHNLNASQELKVAQPGDLNLIEEIKKLTKDIERLETQVLILDPLQKKAELTNNVAELKILEKSKTSLQREINMKELQKQQFIVQENDNSLYGKTQARIQSYVSGNEEGKDFILYIIEILKVSNGDPNNLSAGWLVARRFSQFYKLHNYLKQKYPIVNTIAFPKRKVVLKFQQTALIDERKKDLEAYLVSLLKIQDVCSDKLFRHFLSSNTFNVEDNDEFSKSKTSKGKNAVNMATKLYNGISLQISNVKNKAGVPLMGPSLSMINDSLTLGTTASEMQRELSSFDAQENLGRPPFVKPICDLLVSLFTLQRSNAWIRGRAILLLLQQLLGSTIEKITRQYIDSVKTPNKILNVMLVLQNALWPAPESKFRKSKEPKTPAEKSQTRLEAQKILELFLVDSCSAVFGKTNSKYAADALFGMLQNEVLNTHLFLSAFEEIFAELFPEVAQK